MKRHVLWLTLLGVLGITSLGCGPGAPDGWEPPPGETSEALSAEEVSSEETGDAEFARNCMTTCTGITSSGSACGVVGFGSTTFLGGCRKACRFARRDADAKAATYGCQLQQCSESCS
ncbi:hypothetical protein [Myxococcus landrumensis]|uniref:Lipoprotein n=1 Tax=Myxococcus landrumensis TaxID=2813577 RepID=A0ABX7NI76_9BACT|nr:hypothetical protein [Myxococcus landrumus]QSQ17086.1 hypothetical protein JY572_13935 [Myxococcus landrumus]